MRKLKTSDIPAFCRCVKALGIRDQVEQIAKEADKAADIWDKGFDLVWHIFDIATEKKGEKILYSFLAGPFEKTAQEVEDMDLTDFLSGMKQLAEENDLVTFFKSAGALMK